MGREVRRVPPNWQHPQREDGDFIPLFDGSVRWTDKGKVWENVCEYRQRRWDEEKEAWSRGLRRDFGDETKWVPYDLKYAGTPYEEWDGKRPDAKDYMPYFTPEEATHFQMYEECTEGTPISPIFASPEELARWLADNGASAMGSETATYEQWLNVCRGSYAPSMVFAGGKLMSGVEATELDKK